MSANPSYSFIVPSSCQMYSGTGTAIFDWIRFAKRIFEFSILMDTRDLTNFSITAAFCRNENIKLWPGTPVSVPGCPDPAIKETALLLRSHHFDFVECVSWANAATNMSVLAALADYQILIYTPHTQPIWTIGKNIRTACIPGAFKQMLARANAVIIDSEALLSG